MKAKTAKKRLNIANSCLLIISLFLYYPSIGQAKTGLSLANTAFGFIENKGQIGDQHGRPNPLVKYMLVLRNGMKIQLRADGFSYETFAESVKAGPSNSGLFAFPGRRPSPVAKEMICHRVDISLTGANSDPEIDAENSLSMDFNYYTRNSGPKGVTAKSFSKITYKDIYDGIDMVFVSNPADSITPFEYYFVVNPGANAALIKLRYQGALKTELVNERISITVKRGTFKERIPESYLTSGGLDNQISGNSTYGIHVSYKTNGKDEYRFQVPAYDKTKTLIIDPTPDLIWGTYYGGTDNDFADALAKDGNNNLFICGNTDGQTTLATAGAYQTVLDGQSDGLIAKFDNGGSLLWLTYYGGSSFEEVEGIKIDEEGNVLATGQTFSHDNIATPGAYQTIDNTSGGVPTAFVLKMDNNGVRIWCSYFGGNIAEVAYAIAVDSKDNIFITGFTTSNTGIATPGAYQTSYAGDLITQIPDAFLAKFDKNGARIWATYYGGTGYDLGIGVCVDQQDNVMITGSTASTSGLSTPGSWQPTIASQPPVGGDAFLAKFNNDGKIQWATYYGGDASDAGYCVTTDQANDIIIGGLTASSDNIATPGAQQTTRSPSIGIDYEAFVAKFSTSGQRMWGTYYGNGGSDIVQCITTDPQNNIYLGGLSASTINITTPGSYQPQPQSPTTNAFLAKMSSAGVLQWGTFYGIPGGGWTSGIVVLSDASVVVTGITSSTSNIATCGAVQLNYAGDNDIFLGKFAENVVTRGPSITITPATTGAVCPNSLVTFNATADNGGTAPSYQWLLNGSDVGNNSPSYTANNLVNGDQVSCILTSNSACILAKSATSNIIAVTVVTPSQPQINITASTDTICLGTAVSFIANAITNSQTPLYQWMVNGANVGVNSALFSSGTLNNGDIVSCTVTDNVCNLSNSSSSNKVLMTVNTNILVPSVNITVSSEPVCAGILVTFNATPLNAGNSPRYQWTLNGAVAGVNSAIFQTGSLKEGDTIACMLIPGINGCWSIPEAISNTIKMTIYPAPVIQFSTIDTAILAGASVQLNPAITGNISNYQWTPATGLSDPNIQDPSASPATTTTYQLTVTTDNVCQASAKITLKVVRTLHMPNAFTPDDNGKNTIFRIPANTSLTLKEFSVYDRWGARIFTSTDPNIGWDGTFKGVRCESGVYVYSITGSDSKGPISAKGTVILIR